jgi:hypothetical protein
MILALAALLLPVSPLQPLDNATLVDDKPVLAASLNAAPVEPTQRLAQLADLGLPLPDLSLRAAAALQLSVPDGPAAASTGLPAHPEPAGGATAEASSAPLVAVSPRALRATPPPAGIISVMQLQAEARRQRRTWYLLAAMQHGAAAFDAWSTRRSIANGGRELNPLMKPFANSGAIYAATQIGPVVFDFLGKRMMTSRHPTLRRLWWLPQVAGTAASLLSGAHNLTVHAPAQP